MATNTSVNNKVSTALAQSKAARVAQAIKQRGAVSVSSPRITQQVKNQQAQRTLDAQQKAQQAQASSLSRAYQAARTAAQQRSQQAREQAVKLATPGRVNMPAPAPIAQPAPQPVQQPAPPPPQQIQRAQEVVQAMPPLGQPIQQPPPQQIQRAQEVVQALPAPFELPRVPVMSKTVPGATPGYGGSTPLSQDVTPIQTTPDGNVYDSQGNFMYNMNTGERAAPPQPAMTPQAAYDYIMNPGASLKDPVRLEQANNVLKSAPPGSYSQTWGKMLELPPPQPTPFDKFGAYSGQIQKDYQDFVNAYKGSPWISSYTAEQYVNDPLRLSDINKYKYQDWVKANRPEAVANNYGMNYAEMIGPEQQAYSDYIRSQNQNVYDQYAQYQNKAFNDYYTANPKGSQGFDVYNPFSFSNMIQDASIRMPGQDVLGAFTPPRPQRQPGMGFDEWYTSTYNKPGYQQLAPVQRMNVDFGGFGGFGGFGQTSSEPGIMSLAAPLATPGIMPA